MFLPRMLGSKCLDRKLGSSNRSSSNLYHFPRVVRAPLLMVVWLELAMEVPAMPLESSPCTSLTLSHQVPPPLRWPPHRPSLKIPATHFRAVSPNSNTATTLQV